MPLEVEVLPLVTGHDVEVVVGIDVLVVLSVGIEEKVALQVVIVGDSLIVTVLRGICAREYIILRSFGQLDTGGSVQAEVFKTVYAVVAVDAADKRAHRFV